jgi:hypothetical protein
MERNPPRLFRGNLGRIESWSDRQIVSKIYNLEKSISLSMHYDYACDHKGFAYFGLREHEYEP